jgi:beta-glucosidase
LTLDEKIQLVHSQFAKRDPQNPPPDGPEDEMGYVPGVPRLGIPSLHMVDGSLGVANPWNARDKEEATALPSGIALAATWNPALAFDYGAMAATEARHRGFNVLLAGSINLVRDPHGGRTFEYPGEDPLLAGIMVGENIRGIQSRQVIATIKHFVANDRENGRRSYSVEMDEKALRESDLLAFQIAIERSDPGAVMCAYNKIYGVHACESDFLLNGVLRASWDYRGWVMSDWGAVHSTVKSALAGLDQESGEQFDDDVYFGEPLKHAVESGGLPMTRLDGMVRRILRSMFAKGVIDNPVRKEADDEAVHAIIAQRIAEQAMVLLKNADDLLPLRPGAARIAVIGSHADRAVLAGGGSSQVRPRGGPALTLDPPPHAPRAAPKMVWDPSSPLTAIQAEDAGASVHYADGSDIDAAASLAKNSNLAIVFAHQWMSERWDVRNLSLPDDQDRLIAAVAAANAKTIVVLETGGPVLMPWIDQVGAVLEAWYPGQRGGPAIARTLFGRVSPAGRLPVSFPQSEAQLPLDAQAMPREKAIGQKLAYGEGAALGYRWFEEKGEKPLFSFGYGLSYARFAYSDLKVGKIGRRGHDLTASFTLRNTGDRAAAEVAQIYVSVDGGNDLMPRRLAGWKRIELRPGETRRVSIAFDSHALQLWNAAQRRWEMPAGTYRIHLAASASDDRLTASVAMR